MIITEVERLRWRIWNGKAKDAQISIDRIHALLPSFESEPARKRRRALDAVDRYLHSQSAHLVDYAERHRAGQRVDTALTEGTANFLVNRRMARRSRCAGPGAGPICCSRSAAPSTTARSAPVSGSNSCRPTTHTRQWRWPPDPQLCDGPLSNVYLLYVFDLWAARPLRLAPTWFVWSSMAHLTCGNRPLAGCPNQPCCGGQQSHILAIPHSP